MCKSTLVIGASLKETRYSNLCIKTLVSGHFPVTAIGSLEGVINDIPIQTGFPILDNIHTVTLYLGPQNQEPWFNYILNLKPVRVVFNPGTENRSFENILSCAGIEVVEDCTIMMVESGRF